MFTSPSPPQLKPHGDVIRKTALSLPPLLHFFFFVLGFFPPPAPPRSAHSALMKLWEFRGKRRGWDIARTQSTMGRANFGSSEESVQHVCVCMCVCVCVCVLWRLSVSAYTQECCHTRLYKTSKVRHLLVWAVHRCGSSRIDHLPASRMLIKTFVKQQTRRPVKTSGSPNKPVTQGLCASCWGNPDSRNERATTRGYDVRRAQPDWTHRCQTMLLWLFFNVGFLNISQLGRETEDMFMLLSYMGGMWEKSLYPCVWVSVCVCGGGVPCQIYNEDVIKPRLAPPSPTDAATLPTPPRTRTHNASTHSVSTPRQSPDHQQQWLPAPPPPHPPPAQQ